MFKYRSGEGVYARGTAFWSLALLAFYGGRKFYFFAQQWEFSRRDLLGSPIPVLAFPMTPGFLMGAGVCLLLAYVAWRVVNAPKIADLLVETEVEMKKVTWPSVDDSRKASVVVVVCVAVMVTFLAASDYGLQWFFFHFVYGQGK
jgi:preprotein translocase SecE subunit